MVGDEGSSSNESRLSGLAARVKAGVPSIPRNYSLCSIKDAFSMLHSLQRFRHLLLLMLLLRMMSLRADDVGLKALFDQANRVAVVGWARRLDLSID